MSGHRFELRHASKRYGDIAALSDISLAIGTGQHTAVLGPSGCGKSTALRLLAGLDAPSDGEVLLDGAVVSTAERILVPPYRRGVTMVFQDLALWPNLTVIENVELGQSGNGLPKREVRARANDALGLCGIAALAARLPGTLSGGQQQRVALARAIAPQPAFLFLDEPFAGLDLLTKAALLDEISALAAARQFTILLVTHDPAEATKLCTAVVVLNDGRIEESGMLEDLLSAPRSETLRVLSANLPRAARFTAAS